MITADFIFHWAEKYEKEEGENESIAFTKKGKERVEQDMRNFPSIRKAIFEKGCLERADLEGICEFKSGKRNFASLQENSDNKIEKVTKYVVGNLDKDDVSSLIEKLNSLKGIGVKTASAILAVLAPDEYTIIDYRAARSLIWNELRQESYEEFYRSMEAFRNPSADDYSWYHRKINSISKKTNTTPREVDMALWKFDKDGGNE